jgi:hypothetical protein
MIKIKWSQKGGAPGAPVQQWEYSSIRRQKHLRALSFSLSLSLSLCVYVYVCVCVYTQVHTPHVRTQQEGSYLQGRKKALTRH